MTIKIQDIARKAGVSTATVSRVFSNHPNIREAVRREVMRVAQECGYRPRLSSRQRNVVIISPLKEVYPIRSYVEMVTTELAEVLSKEGYRIEILPQDNLEQLERIQFCGAVSIGYDGSGLENWGERFGVPLILIDRDLPPGAGDEVYSVRSDEFQAMSLGIGHLAGSGCSRVGCIIYGEENRGNANLRRDGALRALAHFGLPAERTLIRFALAEEYVAAVGKLRQSEIDGLFAPGGNAGVIASYALNLYGRRIPADISLVASERTVFSRYATPPQTTITQDYAEQARITAELLAARLEGRSCPAATVIPYHLIERDSVRQRDLATSSQRTPNNG